MAERYKLPDALGGGEYEGAIEERLAGVIRLNFNGRAIYVPVDMLIKVSAPIPPEPEPGAYLVGDSMALAVRFENDGDPNWLSMPGGWRHWEDLWRDLGGPDVTITPLVPAEPEVALPWIGGNDADPGGDVIRVDMFDGDHVPVSIPGRSMVYLNPHKAEAMARALLAASRAES